MTPDAQTSQSGPPDLAGAVGLIFQTLIDSTREAVLVVDAALRVVAANQAARDSFVDQPTPIEGRRLSEVIRDAGLHTAFRAALDASARSDIRLETEGTAGSHVYDVHIAPIDSDSGRLAIGFFYDVTRIEGLEKIRKEFLSNISHELRTPLTSILAFVETLEDGAIDDREHNRRFVSVIRRNAERMHALVSDILDLSMIESGNVTIEKSAVAVSPLVDEIFSSLVSQAVGREVSLENQIPHDASMWADSRRLAQMLTNLIDNAIKFNRKGGTVTVSFRSTADLDAITVADTGEGIRADHLGRIFERFYRLDRGRSREVGGTGLGLAIVKHLALLHGGEISARSVLGEGTSFTIQLPQRQ